MNTTPELAVRGRERRTARRPEEERCATEVEIAGIRVPRGAAGPGDAQVRRQLDDAVPVARVVDDAAAVVVVLVEFPMPVKSSFPAGSTDAPPHPQIPPRLSSPGTGSKTAACVARSTSTATSLPFACSFSSSPTSQYDATGTSSMLRRRRRPPQTYSRCSSSSSAVIEMGQPRFSAPVRSSSAWSQPSGRDDVDDAALEVDGSGRADPPPGPQLASESTTPNVLVQSTLPLPGRNAYTEPLWWRR